MTSSFFVRRLQVSRSQTVS